jgi:opacity protein-like surface antigen
MSGGAWIPTADLVGGPGFDGKGSADVSFGAHFVLNMGWISYRAGFSEHRFGCNQAQCGEAVDFVSTAWDLGVRVNIRQEGIIPWVGLGATAALVDAHVGAGPGGVREASDRGWGYEVGAGLLVPVVGPVSINPGVRYGRVDVDFALPRGTLETRYITADVSVVLSF